MKETPVYAVVVKSEPEFVAYLGSTQAEQVSPRAVFWRYREAMAFAKELREHITDRRVVVERRIQCRKCDASGYALAR